MEREPDEPEWESPLCIPEGLGPLEEADYWAFPEDGRSRQLLDGWEVLMPPVRLRHQHAVEQLLFRFLLFLKDHPLGEAHSGPYPVRLSGKSMVEPDLFFVRQERLEILEDKLCVAAPDLVVEVLSPTNRRVDEIRKLRLYERHGVEEYWILDPVVQLVKVFRRNGERLEIAAQVMADREEQLTTPLLPGLKVPVAELFRTSASSDRS